MATIRRARPGRSLAELYPLIAAEWVTEANPDIVLEHIAASSGFRGTWRCADCGHIWEAFVYARTRLGGGCPRCGHQRISESRSQPTPGRALDEAAPQIAAEWDSVRNGMTPQDVAVSSSRRAWWICSLCGGSWQAVVGNRTKAEAAPGCPACSKARGAARRRTPKDGRSLADLRPDLALEWDEDSNGAPASSVSARAARKATWHCQTCGHRWETTVANRALSGCPMCARRAHGVKVAVPKPGTSLADVRPDIAALWHPTLNSPLTPADVKPYSLKVVWWWCEYGEHSYQAEVRGRSRGNRCEQCRPKQLGIMHATPAQGESLSDRYPDVAAKWHPAKNQASPDQVKPRSMRRVWWLCPKCGDEWAATVSNVTGAKKTGCPTCGRETGRTQRMAPLPGKSFGECHPDLVPLWADGNDRTVYDVKPASAYRASWVCTKGHVWQSKVHNVAAGRGCPTCVVPTSKVDLALRAGLASAGFTIDDVHQVKRYERRAGKGRNNPWNVDVLSSAHRFVIEFDGSWWHGEGAPGGSAAQRQRDRDKAADLRANGYTVIRVREQPLRRLHPDDIVVPQTLDYAQFVAAVIAKLATLGIDPRPSTGGAVEADRAA